MPRLHRGDPFDRLIVVEDLTLRVPFVPKDGSLTDSGFVWVVLWPGVANRSRALLTEVGAPRWLGATRVVFASLR